MNPMWAYDIACLIWIGLIMKRSAVTKCSIAVKKNSVHRVGHYERKWTLTYY